MSSKMNFKISQGYFETLAKKNISVEFLNKLHVFKDKEYSSTEQYQNDLNLLFSDDFMDLK